MSFMRREKSAGRSHDSEKMDKSPPSKITSLHTHTDTDMPMCLCVCVDTYTPCIKYMKQRESCVMISLALDLRRLNPTNVVPFSFFWHKSQVTQQQRGSPAVCLWLWDKPDMPHSFSKDDAFLNAGHLQRVAASAAVADDPSATFTQQSHEVVAVWSPGQT